MVTGLFIGRFQPFHKAHLEDVRRILKECDRIVIGIGSSLKKNTLDNPFSSNERVEMIKRVLDSEGISNYSFCEIADVGDDKLWVDKVFEVCGKFEKVYTGNEWTENCFRKYNLKNGSAIEIKKIKLIPGINSTIIRDNISNGREWKNLVHHEVFEFIKEIKGDERIKNISNS